MKNQRLIDLSLLEAHPFEVEDIVSQSTLFVGSASCSNFDLYHDGMPDNDTDQENTRIQITFSAHTQD